jgi:hypothetical protein
MLRRFVFVAFVLAGLSFATVGCSSKDSGEGQPKQKDQGKAPEKLPGASTGEKGAPKGSGE